MKYFNLGLEADIRGDFLSAIKYYEESISQNEKQVDTYLNLAIIYWEIGWDYGISSYHKINKDLIHVAAERYEVILEIAKKEFPNNIEVEFWRRYIDNINLGKEFSIEECETLVQRDKNSLVPYSYLYLYNKDKYKNEVDKLYSIVSKELTEKNQYIKNMIDHDKKRKNKV